MTDELFARLCAMTKTAPDLLEQPPAVLLQQFAIWTSELAGELFYARVADDHFVLEEVYIQLGRLALLCQRAASLMGQTPTAAPCPDDAGPRVGPPFWRFAGDGEKEDAD